MSNDTLVILESLKQEVADLKTLVQTTAATKRTSKKSERFANIPAERPVTSGQLWSIFTAAGNEGYKVPWKAVKPLMGTLTHGDVQPVLSSRSGAADLLRKYDDQIRMNAQALGLELKF